jgi:hypothetical protein
MSFAVLHDVRLAANEGGKRNGGKQFYHHDWRYFDGAAILGYASPQRAYRTGEIAPRCNLEDAVQEYRKYSRAHDANGKKRSREAEEWIMRWGNDWIFSFDNVCELLGLDPEYVRRGLRETVGTSAEEEKSMQRDRIRQGHSVEVGHPNIRKHKIKLGIFYPLDGLRPVICLRHFNHWCKQFLLHRLDADFYAARRIIMPPVCARCISGP